MTIILKREYDKLLQKKFLNPKEILIKNTHHFSNKFDINIIYRNIDYLRVKLLKDTNSNLFHIEYKLLTVYIHEDIYNNDLSQIYNKLMLFDKFFVVYSGMTFSNQVKVYSIYDLDKNKVWQLLLKVAQNVKSNRNVIDSIEFKWLFFKSYLNYLQMFFDYFDVDTKKQDILKRLDYCIDIKGIEVFMLYDYLKLKYQISKNYEALHATDVKELNNWSSIKYWRQETYKNFTSNDNDLKLYDKILDLISPKKIKRKVNWVNPYQDYIDSDVPITRIEVKKKNFKSFRDNSIDWMFQNIEALFFDYLLRFLNIDLSLYVWQDINLNWKKIFLAKEEKSKSLYHSMIMAKAYLENIKNLSSDHKLHRFLFDNYPDLRFINPFDLFDEFEQHDILNT